MITTEQIKKANEKIAFTDIKGKNYATVNERVKAFREICPNATISTELVKEQDGECIFKASIYDDGVLIATGYAREEKGNGYINKLSHLENCETSSVGRALGFLGLGIEDEIATADEVKNAEINDKAKDTIDAVTLKALETRCKNDGVDVEALCKLYTVKTLADVTNKMHANMHEHWDKITLMSKGRDGKKERSEDLSIK